MELQLGLSLPIHGLSNDGFNLLPKKKLDLEPWTRDGLYKKRSFEDAFGEIEEDPSQTLPLLLWSGQPNDDDKGEKKRIPCIINRNDDEDENQVVGWPPIKSCRKKLLNRHQGVQMADNQMAAGNENGGISNSKYVKVKMEGVAIARKVDLRLFHSYQTLTNSLISMFNKSQKLAQEDARYTLTYQDKDGDWLLAGDVPWQTFVESVQRLEIVRNGG